MSDTWVIALAVATWIGAWYELRISLFAAVAVAAVGAWRRWPLALCIAGFIAASALASHARDGLRPLPSESYVGIVTVVRDPQPYGPGTRVEVKVGDAHVDAVAFGGSGRKLARIRAGELVEMQGRLGPLPGASRERRQQVHISTQLAVTFVGDRSPGSPLARSANRVRAALDRGAAVMPPTERSFFLGFVIGDDRAQPRSLVDTMRDTGLSHLSAVSGENVAFVLVGARPLLQRLTLRWRWAATCGLVCWFAVLTRFEPSVLRACAMAVLAVTSWYLARPASPLRLLALATTAMVLADPFLVHAPGWWLSVGATAGIVLWSRPIADALPGPRAFGEAVGVTAAAQLGVAPVQLALFGSLPVVSIAANLFAVPVAGLVMVIGLPAGVIAGYLPAGAARVLHVPSLLGVRWVLLVARIAERVPAGHLGPIPLAVLVIVSWWAMRWRRRRGVVAGRASTEVQSVRSTVNGLGASGEGERRVARVGGAPAARP
jgi:competence protein ComEC